MGVYGASVTKLIEQFEKLPGIGRKSAQRMAFYLLGRTEQEAEEFDKQFPKTGIQIKID